MVFHWSITNWKEAIFLIKITIPLLDTMNCQELHKQGWYIVSTIPLHAAILSGLSLCRTHAVGLNDFESSCLPHSVVSKKKKIFFGIINCFCIFKSFHFLFYNFLWTLRKCLSLYLCLKYKLSYNFIFFLQFLPSKPSSITLLDPFQIHDLLKLIAVTCV